MSAEKLKLGVMGWPVRQSRSPELFYETFAGRTDVLDRFSYELLEESDFDHAFERFDREYYAINVTIPYKESAFKAADDASHLCRAVGAANLLIHQDGRLMAHNTDIIAVAEILRNHLAEPLREQKCPICTPDDSPTGLREQKCPICTPRLKVLVVGCGGAGKAAAAAAISIGAEVIISNRTPDTALQFIDYLKSARYTSRDKNSFRHLDSESPQNPPQDSRTSTEMKTSIRFTPLESFQDEVLWADFIIYTLPVAIHELEHCDFTGKTVLEAKYYDTSIKPAPGMTYIPGTEWLRLQALATYRILGLIQ